MKDTEEQVKKHLAKIVKIDGGYDALRDIMWRKTIVERLRSVRRAQGITQAQIAERMGVTQGRVAEIENEPWPDPYISTLARYAHALGMAVEFEAVPWFEEPAEAPVDKSHDCSEKDCPYVADYPHAHNGYLGKAQNVRVPVPEDLT